MFFRSLYLALRRVALTTGLHPSVYRPFAVAMRRVLGVSDTLIDDMEAETRQRAVDTVIESSKTETGSTEVTSAIDIALREYGSDEFSDILFHRLRGLPSRAMLCLTCALLSRPEAELRQTARLLLADRAAFWRDFRTVETRIEEYLSEEDGQSPERTDIALDLMVSAKRRLDKTGEALEVNRQQASRHPLNIKFIAQRARILILEDPDEMVRLLHLCDAQNGRAGLLGNTLYLSYLLETEAYDEVERLARGIEARASPSRLGRAFLNNAKIARDGDVSVLPKVFRTLGLDCEIGMASFDALRLSRPHAVHSEGPLVSVVMTAFNAEVHIGTAVAAILGQSYPNLELIVVDDCSTDGTANRVHEIAETDSRLQYMCLAKNSGTYVAKNEGIRSATGTFITLCDSDDMWTEDHVACHLDAMQADPEVAVSTSEWLRLFDDARIDINPDGTIVEVCPHSTFFRRDVFDRVGYFDSVRFGADREFVSRITLEYGGLAVHHIPQVLTLGRRHATSLTTFGAGMIGPGQKSDIRLAYWGIWNAWQTERALGSERLFNSGRPDERPYTVPKEMEP